MAKQLPDELTTNMTRKWQAFKGKADLKSLLLDRVKDKIAARMPIHDILWEEEFDIPDGFALALEELFQKQPQERTAERILEVLETVEPGADLWTVYLELCAVLLESAKANALTTDLQSIMDLAARYFRERCADLTNWKNLRSTWLWKVRPKENESAAAIKSSIFEEARARIRDAPNPEAAASIAAKLVNTPAHLMSGLLLAAAVVECLLFDTASIDRTLRWVAHATEDAAKTYGALADKLLELVKRFTPGHNLDPLEHGPA